MPTGDPLRKVTFVGESTRPNLPEMNRIGRPRVNWTIGAMSRVWEELQLDKANESTEGQKFNYENEKHLETILEAARAELF